MMTVPFSLSRSIGNIKMQFTDYLKTFVLVIVFIFLSIICVTNVITHFKENKPKREEKKRRKKEAKMAKRAKRLGQPWPPVDASEADDDEEEADADDEAAETEKEYIEEETEEPEDDRTAD
jgi:flagellar biosynthesis/type III secretory pathway M-ring protein FliF/YscJ